MLKLAVLGPGGVGGFVAAALTRAGEDVFVVARPRTAGLIAERGIEVRSAALGAEFLARPRAGDHLDADADVDVLLVTTKAGGLGSALRRVGSEPGLIVPLLNGIEHMDVLRTRFGAQHVVAGVIRIESDRAAAGVIVQSSPTARVDLAAGGASGPDAVARLAAALEGAGIPVRREASEAQVLWSKLARLTALALTTSASDRPIGCVRSDPRWRSALQGAIGETVLVANAEGATLDAAGTLAELDQAPAGLGSSMRRDIAAGRPPELDAIAGAVLRAAARHGLRCPTVTWLAEQVAGRALSG